MLGTLTMVRSHFKLSNTILNLLILLINIRTTSNLVDKLSGLVCRTQITVFNNTQIMFISRPFVIRIVVGICKGWLLPSKLHHNALKSIYTFRNHIVLCHDPIPRLNVFFSKNISFTLYLIDVT